jgi:hypothetical protein
LQENIYSGRAGEFFAAYVLESMGLRTVHVDLPHDDLWVKTPENEHICVQVKSSRGPHDRKDRIKESLIYSFQVNKGGRLKFYNGIFMFVALDKQLCFAQRWDDNPPRTYKLTPMRFSKEAQVNSIKREFKI